MYSEKNDEVEKARKEPVLEDKWLQRNVGVAFAYWEPRIAEGQLRQKCIESVMSMIQGYRPSEKPEDYRETIESQVQQIFDLNGI
jgi:hypothetical protein